MSLVSWPNLLRSLCGHACCIGLLCAMSGTPAPEAPVYQLSLVTAMPGQHAASSSGLEAPSQPAGGPKKGTDSPVPPPPSPSPPTRPPAPQATRALAQKTSPRPPKVRKNPSAAPTAPAAAESPLAPQPPAAEGTEAGAASTKGAEGQHGEGAESAKKRGTGTGNASNVFAAHQVDHMPAVTRSVSPVYPPRAKKERLEGRVMVRLVVDTSGRPSQCAVDNATPQGCFEEAALEAAHKMRFRPGKKDGKVVNTLVLLPFVFRLR
ncbi:MAG: energy transducer TonB [Desulfovibrionaceae bacterium]